MWVSSLRRLDDMLSRGEDLFLSLSHGVIAALVIIAVIFRYLLDDPLTWTEEFIIILFVWMLFIGFSSGFHKRMHIRIDALLLVLPHRARTAFGVVAVAATVFTLGALVWFGTQQVLIMVGTQTPMLRVSVNWLMSALPVASLFSIIHILRFALTDGLAETLWPADIAGSNEGH